MAAGRECSPLWGDAQRAEGNQTVRAARIPGTSLTYSSTHHSHSLRLPNESGNGHIIPFSPLQGRCPPGQRGIKQTRPKGTPNNRTSPLIKC